MSSVEISEIAHRVALIVNSRVVCLSDPVDPLVNAMELVFKRGRLGDGKPVAEGVSLIFPYLRPVSAYFSHVSGFGLRTFDLDAAAAGNRFMVGADFFLIDRQDNSNIPRFVVSPVGYEVDAWLFPVTFPVDVARVALSQIGPLSDRQRFFAYYAGIYCDALAIFGDDVRVRAELVRSVRLLDGLLGELASRS